MVNYGSVVSSVFRAYDGIKGCRCIEDRQNWICVYHRKRLRPAVDDCCPIIGRSDFIKIIKETTQLEMCMTRHTIIVGVVQEGLLI